MRQVRGVFSTALSSRPLRDRTAFSRGKRCWERRAIPVLLLSLGFLVACDVGSFEDPVPMDVAEGPEEDVGSIVQSLTTAEKPAWKMLAIVIRNTDVTWTDASGTHRLVASMTGSELHREAGRRLLLGWANRRVGYVGQARAPGVRGRVCTVDSAQRRR